MDNLTENFIIKHPKDAARVIEKVPEEHFVLFFQSNFELCLNMLSFIAPFYLSRVLIIIDIKLASKIIESLPLTQAATLLRMISTNNRAVLLHELQDKKRLDLQRILEYNKSELGYYLEEAHYVLLSDSHIEQALEIVDNFEQGKEEPIFVIDTDSRLLGCVSPFLLIKKRNEPVKTLMETIQSIDVAFSAAIPLKHVISHSVWLTHEQVPVTGKLHNFLGIVKKTRLKGQQVGEVGARDKRTPLEEYLFFSELIWTGLQRFWGSLR